MTVAELIKELQKQNQDAPVILSVYGHFYHSEYDKSSHGSMTVYEKKYDWGTLNIPKGIVIEA